MTRLERAFLTGFIKAAELNNPSTPAKPAAPQTASTVPNIGSMAGNIGINSNNFQQAGTDVLNAYNKYQTYEQTPFWRRATGINNSRPNLTLSENNLTKDILNQPEAGTALYNQI